VGDGEGSENAGALGGGFSLGAGNREDAEGAEGTVVNRGGGGDGLWA